MKEEAVAIGGENKRDVEDFGIIDSLLHTTAEGLLVILGFDNGYGEVGFEIDDIVGTFAFAFDNGLATHGDTAISEVNFFSNLCLNTPPN